jgi:hypothetical protein
MEVTLEPEQAAAFAVSLHNAAKEATTELSIPSDAVEQGAVGV